MQDPGEDRSFHVVITAEGSAVHWQSRVHYYWYKKIKAQCEANGACQMGGFTRLLHSGKPDDLMDEIPSFVVHPLPPDKQDNKGYVVLNRPYAFVQWTQQAKIKEKYIIMSEPDHVWLKPMPNLMKVRLACLGKLLFLSFCTSSNIFGSTACGCREEGLPHSRFSISNLPGRTSCTSQKSLRDL